MDEIGEIQYIKQANVDLLTLLPIKYHTTHIRIHWLPYFMLETMVEVFLRSYQKTQCVRIESTSLCLSPRDARRKACTKVKLALLCNIQGAGGKARIWLTRTKMFWDTLVYPRSWYLKHPFSLFAHLSSRFSLDLRLHSRWSTEINFLVAGRKTEETGTDYRYAAKPYFLLCLCSLLVHNCTFVSTIQS